MLCLEGNGYRAAFDHATGGFRSFCAHGEEQLALEARNPLAEIRMLRADGTLCLLESDAARTIRVKLDGTNLLAGYEGFPGFENLRVTIRAAAEADGLRFTAKIDNGTDAFVENFACPCVSVPGKLIGDGGDSRIFWPYAEGLVYEEASRCVGEQVRGTDFASLGRSRNLIYPGFVQMQYMARYARDKGMYLAAHDTEGMPKTIAVYRHDGCLRMDIRTFPCVAPHSQWEQAFPVVAAPMRGDWQDASEMYRDFLEHSAFPLPPRLSENPRFPRWALKHPVVVIYPPRSVRGTGYMGPNEFFPYVHSIKYLEDLSEDIDSDIMAFLPYWEGTAPWAGPYSWPPFGGEAPFQEYVDRMHAKGWRVGVYASGLNWTDRHLTTDYDRTQERIQRGLTKDMCRLPGEALLPGICTSIRTGYCMCSQCDETKAIAYDEFSHMLDANVDYAQYFDQHMGGQGYICYGAEHGHPACYGKWSVESMRAIYKHMFGMIGEKNRDAAIGTEGAPADFYADKLYFNDLRWHLSMARGVPVPAYNYVLHAYCLNFMGNQCDVDANISRAENPDSLLYAIAYSFAAGDLLTLVLKSGGEIHYDWGMSWLHPGPRQRPVKALVRNLSGMRRRMEKFLQGGRMLKTLPFGQKGMFQMRRRDGTVLTVGEVLSSRWQAEDGETMQLFVNHTQHDVEISFDAPYASAIQAQDREAWQDGRKVVPALSCVAVILR